VSLSFIKIWNNFKDEEIDENIVYKDQNEDNY
jgi:hypothetical protein